MSWTICIPVPKDRTTIDGSRKICFFIPQVRPPQLKPGPPDPPFVTHPNFDRAIAWQLQALATIDELAETLPAELSRDIQRSVDAHMQSLGQKLGVGIELCRHPTERVRNLDTKQSAGLLETA